MNMPGFTAQSSLIRGSSSRAAAWNHSGQALEKSLIAADVPGGPGNVPIGYRGECT